MSTIITPTAPVQVQISAQPGSPAIAIAAYVDPASAPPGSDAGGVAFGLLCLAVSWNRAVMLALANRIAMLEIHAAELHAPATGGTEEEQARRASRLQTARATITLQAAQLEINAPAEEAPTPPSALDDLEIV